MHLGEEKLTTRGCSQYSRAVGLVDGVVVELSPDITGQWWSLKQKDGFHTYKGG